MNNISELVFILDRSGSMHGLEPDTIGGFNSLIEKQKKVDGKCWVTTVLFSDRSDLVHDRADLGEIRPMTGEDYTVGGCTALLDAVGGAIRHIARIHRYARPEDVPGSTTFVIMTDGMENASREYDYARVRRMIEHEKEKYGWEFLFLAANIDAAETGRQFGITADRAVNYHADRAGTKLAFDTVAAAVCAPRMGRPIDADWSGALRADNEKRRKG